MGLLLFMCVSDDVKKWFIYKDESSTTLNNVSDNAETCSKRGYSDVIKRFK